ncbi:MAG: glycoside hydrolase family 13 protein [Candidatus Limiplasma sp.]|nr:glycoside hydrolase family 13 protein [Candidatus Limiplasma sp.]
MKALIALHEASRAYVYPLSERAICLGLRASERVEATVRYHNKNRPQEPWAEQPMACLGFDGALYRYETVLHTREKTRYLAYCFALAYQGETVWLCASGLAGERPEAGFFEYLYTQESDLPRRPPWAQNAVIYQIFPDRFARDPAQQADRPLRAWGDPPDREGFWGGNLAGIRRRIPYLVEMGVDAVYLNPVFQSPSNHRYDTADYETVDPLLGTAEELEALARELHARGIRLILDAVLDHCGVDFAPFRDVVKNGEASPYRDWFFIDRYPIAFDPPSYEAIGYYKAMPKLRLGNPQVQEYFLGVLEYWTKRLDLDGWRFDVSDEIDPEFLRRMQRRLRRLSPDVLLIGEAWQENPDLVSCCRLDGVIHYPFQRAAVDFFAKDALDPERFTQRMVRALAAYPAYARTWNVCMLDCHDTARFWELCGQDLERLRCALAYQLLYPGIRLVYYGDEAGLPGGPDPDCRRAMPWGNLDRRVRELYLAWLRCAGALKTGETAVVDDYLPVVALRRREGKRTLWALVNMGEERQVTLKGGLLEVLFGLDSALADGNGTQTKVRLGKRQCVALAVQEDGPADGGGEQGEAGSRSGAGLGEGPQRG